MKSSQKHKEQRTHSLVMDSKITLVLLVLFALFLLNLQHIFFSFSHLDSQLNEGLALYYSKQSDFSKAETYLLQSIAPEYNPSRIYYELADLYKNWGKDEKYYFNLVRGTIAHYKSGAPDCASSDIYLSIIEYELTHALFSQAQETILFFLDAYPAHQKRLFALVRALIEKNPQITNTIMANIFIRLGRYDEAKKILSAFPVKDTHDFNNIARCAKRLNINPDDFFLAAISGEKPDLSALLSGDEITTNPILISCAREQLDNKYTELARLAPPANKSFLPLNAFSVKYDITFSLNKPENLYLAYRMRSVPVVNVSGLLYVLTKNNTTGEEIIRQIYVNATDWRWFILPLQLDPGAYTLTFRLGNNFYIENVFDRSIFLKDFRLYSS